MKGYVARALCLIPGWITGRASASAGNLLNDWTGSNSTRRAYAYGYLSRLLLLGGVHPLFFICLVAGLAAVLAALGTCQFFDQLPALSAPSLKKEFDMAAYFAVPWAVQATLVGLVYPIVISFIALILQRRAHSAVALRVYVLDSAVIPAGASSIGLLVAQGALYFSALHADQELVVPALIFSGAWLAINILLTGYFLGRTILFLQEDEQRQAFLRLAVNVVLKGEISASLKEHLISTAPSRDWGFSDDAINGQVHMHPWHKGTPEVVRELKGNQSLDDVHLRLLKWVAKSWLRKAGSGKWGAAGNQPSISFPSAIGSGKSGQVKLCFIKDGPPLSRLQKFVVSIAFVYRPVSENGVLPSISSMLAEIGIEVETLAEQHRYKAATEVLAILLKMHRTLLLACADSDIGAANNAATISTSVYSISANPFNVEWLKPYRDISRIAVDLIDSDLQLFRSVAYLPAKLAAVLPPKPEQLLVSTLLVARNLTYHLSTWWTRQAQATLPLGAASFGGTLPNPANKVYEQALIEFVGAWGGFHVRLPDRAVTSDENYWSAISSRALVYASHIDQSAKLFLDAVSRGDEVASDWFCDQFLKWWGIRASELPHGNLGYDKNYRRVSLSLAKEPWSSLGDTLGYGEGVVSIPLAETALNLAVRRYWESMRFTLILLLLKNVNSVAEGPCRGLRLAGSLIRGEALKRGGSVEAEPLGEVDSVVGAMLNACFGDEIVHQRMNGFLENLHQERHAPVVAGWIYGWSGMPNDVQSMVSEHAQLLVAVASGDSHGSRRGKVFVEDCWRDTDKLAAILRFARELENSIQQTDLTQVVGPAQALRTALGNTTTVDSALVGAANAVRKIGEVATWERRLTLDILDVDEAIIRLVAKQVGQNAFGGLPSEAVPFENVVCGSSRHAIQLAYRFSYDKERLLRGAVHGWDDNVAGVYGEEIRRHTTAHVFSDYVRRFDLVPVDSHGIHSVQDLPVENGVEFLKSIANQAHEMRASGRAPVILVSVGPLAQTLRPYRWNQPDSNLALPPNVELRSNSVARGERAMAYLNETPIFELPYTADGCYVVPLQEVLTLFVSGRDAASAVKGSWVPKDDEKVLIELTWAASLGPDVSTTAHRV